MSVSGTIGDRERYQQYLCSREWGVLKEAVRKRCDGICERCYYHEMYAVHHLTYVRKYRERPEDLQGLCEGCHEFIHGKRDRDPILDSPPRIRGETIRSVYLAGRFSGNNWRSEIMPRYAWQKHEGSSYGDGRVNIKHETGMHRWGWPARVEIPDGRTIGFVGPCWLNLNDEGSHLYGKDVGHGEIQTDRQLLLHLCQSAIVSASLVFAWLDSRECFGTLVEIGYYRRSEGGILAVAMPKWDPELWFAAGLSDVFIIAGTAAAAWQALWSGQFEDPYSQDNPRDGWPQRDPVPDDSDEDDAW